MTNEEAIKVIKTSPLLSRCNGKSAFAEAVNTVIKSMETPKESPWVPCSKRLPEEGGYYLTTTIYQEVYCDYWNGDNFGRTEMVIAWKPLPEPWKGEQNG